MPKRVLLLCVLCALASSAGAETCQFDTSATYVCNSVDNCTPNPTGCTGGDPTPNDFWDVGSGQNERVRVAIGGATAGTFRLTFDGQTSAPIPYPMSGIALEAGLLSIPGIERSDFAIASSTADAMDWDWTGARGCQNAPAVTCDGSGLVGPNPVCTVTVPVPGLAPTGAPVLRIEGDWTQDATPGAGLRVRCDGTLIVDSPTGRTLTVGNVGLHLEHGATSTVRGGIRGPAGAHTPPHAEADVWTTLGITNCPEGDCALRRLVFGERTAGLEATLGSVAAPGDVVWFPLGGGSMDEGFWYDVAARSATPPWLDLDTRQSATNSSGWSLAQKGITPATLAAPVATGDTSLVLVDGAIATDDDFVGMCVYVSGTPHLVKRTTASTDVVELVREDGSRRSAPAGASVEFSTSCHRALDEIVIAAPIRIRSATTGTAPAQQNDMPVLIRGNLFWDWVVVEAAGAGGVRFDGIDGTLDHFWTKDRDLETFSLLFSNTHDQEIGSLQATGAPDLDGATSYADCSDGSDCNAHGLGLGGAVGNRIAWVGQRHLGDDCHVNFLSRGLSDNQVEILRCQQRLGSVRSMQCVSALGAAPVVSVGTLECLKATGRGATYVSPGGNTFSGGPDTRLRIDSAFTLHGRSLGDNNTIGDFENLYALRNEEAASPFFQEQTAGVQRLRNFVIAEPRGLQVFWLASRCQQLSNGVVLGGVVEGNVTGNNVLLAATPPCPHEPDLVDNVGLIDFDVQDASDPSNVVVGRVSNGSSGLLRNLLLYWTTPPADRRPDQGLTDAGGTVSTGATVSQVAIVGWNGSVGHAFDFTPTSAATVSVGAGAHCFADNASNYPAAIASLLPPGTLVGPRPSFPPHSFVAPPGSAWDQAGCGLRGSPGVCAWQRWHQWEDLPLQQTCFGALLEQCGNGAQEPGEECDDGNAADGDGCSAACESQTSLELAGVATGGAVEVAIHGVPVGVATVPGQSAAEVAAALAAAIGANPTLAGAGVYALSQGGALVTNGVLGGFESSDGGIGLAAAAIGALSFAGAALLAAAIALAGGYVPRSGRPAAQ